jgi:hypothetical protein
MNIPWKSQSRRPKTRQEHAKPRAKAVLWLAPGIDVSPDGTRLYVASS